MSKTPEQMNEELAATSLAEIDRMTGEQLKEFAKREVKNNYLRSIYQGTNVIPISSAPPVPIDEPQETSTRQPDGYPTTDYGNAQRLVRDHRGKMMYCYPWKSWLVWDKKRWKPDDTGAIVKLAKRTVRGMKRQASKIEVKTHADALWKHWMKSEAGRSIREMIALAQDEVPIAPDELDKSNWMLTVNNGTINLKTGELKPHNPADHITKLAPVDYDPKATCPRFIRFLSEVFIDKAGQPDYDLIAYIQRVLGYSLTGSVKEQCFFILYGTGANGKGTLLGLLAEMLGEYSNEARPEFLMKQKRQASSASEDEADLQGMRLVKASETDAGRGLSEALVKRLTGGDRIKCRRNHGHNFEFSPTHKLYLLTNHKPEIKGTDHSIWRRVHMIPFNATFKPGDDPTIEQDLRAEAPGILNWLITGCLEWQEGGLNPPEAVLAAVEEYRAEMDALQGFIDECCTMLDGLGQVKASVLFKAYKQWALDRGDDPGNMTRFGERMKEKGIIKKRKKDGQWYQGISISSEVSETAPF